MGKDIVPKHVPFHQSLLRQGQRGTSHHTGHGDAGYMGAALREQADLTNRSLPGAELYKASLAKEVTVSRELWERCALAPSALQDSNA